MYFKLICLFSYQCVFLVGLTCLLLVDGFHFGVQPEEEENGALVFVSLVLNLKA
jgi:hypothetical protein